MQQINKRLLKADCILKLPYPVLRDENDKTKTHFFVRASDITQYYFREHYYYSVRYFNDNKYQKWDCECIDFTKNCQYDLSFMCKHCYAVQIAVTRKRRLRHIDPRDLIPITEP
jgi:hypothetical protein